MAKLDEFKSYLDNGALRLADKRKLSGDVNFLTGRWVLTVKVDKNGYFSKFKARWVCRGFQDRHAWEQQTDSPTAATLLVRTSTRLRAPTWREQHTNTCPSPTCFVKFVFFGKCPSQEEIEEKNGSRNLKDYDRTNMSEDLTRAGMNVMRVCVFHMKSHIASRQPGFCHEAYGIMLADCFAFQADIMSGDANMSAYRYAGTRQQSSSLKHSCWQDMVRYFVKGHNEAMGQDPNCRVVPRFVSSNPLSSLRWWEDTFGQEYNKCRVVNWDTVPDLDCLVSCVLE